MFTAAFLKAAFERAVRTFAQTLLAVFGADQFFDVLHADWENALSVAAGATVLSFLTSIVASQVGGTGPSLANEVTSPPAPPIQD